MSALLDSELSVIEKVVELKKSLTSCLESPRADQAESLCTILKQLQDVNVTKQVVTKSGIGGLIGRLRKNENASVASMATTVVNSWKSILRSNSKGATKPPVAKKAKSVADKGGEAAPKLLRRASSTPAIVKPITGDRRRDVMIAKFTTALLVTLEEADEEMALKEEDIDKIALAVELALHTQLAEDDNKLKAKFLQLLHALRDKQNGQLRLRIVVGHVLPEEFVEMSVEDLANAQLKAERQALDQYHKEASKSRKVATQVTDRFGICAKCKCKKQSYFMMQTRSADEPMTIFISCIQCGHAWRK